MTSRIAVVVNAALFALLAACLVMPIWPHVGASTINSDRTKLAQLEQHVANQGEQVQSLVTRFNQVSGQLAEIKDKIASDNQHLATDRRAQKKAAIGLRSVAVASYVSQASGNSTAISSFTNSVSASTLAEKEEYLGVANARLGDAITTYQLVEHQTEATESALKSKETEVTSTLATLASARQGAQAALGSEDATLSHLHSNLLSLVTVAEQKVAAVKAEQEEALAAEQQASLQQTGTAAAPLPTVNPAPGKYANPLRSISGLSPERVDQGVDYGGFGPIYALGDGVVLSTFNGGWPGGTFITYRLTDGPAAGLVVYAAEDIEPTVQIGESVTPRTALGQVYEGPDGIETGWADPSGDGSTMAADNGQFGGANSTAFGYNFSQLLESLGARGGILQNNPATDSVPAGWPQW